LGTEGCKYGYMHSSSKYYVLPTIPSLTFLGAFEKLQKATISFFRSIRPSVYPHGTTKLPLDEFSLNLTYLSIFRKYDEKIQVSLKYDKNNGYFT